MGKPWWRTNYVLPFNLTTFQMFLSDSKTNTPRTKIDMTDSLTNALQALNDYPRRARRLRPWPIRTIG